MCFIHTILSILLGSICKDLVRPPELDGMRRGGGFERLRTKQHGQCDLGEEDDEVGLAARKAGVLGKGEHIRDARGGDRGVHDRLERLAE